MRLAELFSEGGQQLVELLWHWVSKDGWENVESLSAIRNVIARSRNLATLYGG